MPSLRRILVPTDFSPCSDAALNTAITLASAFDAAITLLHAYEIPAYSYPGAAFLPVVDITKSIEKAAQTALVTKLNEVIPRWPRAEGLLRCGSPPREILDATKSLDVDLIVMGTHGRRGVERVLLGSVAARVVRTSPVPVLTVRSES